MQNSIAKELKIKFIEALNEQTGFAYEDGNPFLIKLGAKRFFVFLRNLKPAYLRNSPDVTRIQLPMNNHFDKIFKVSIPFVALGYDAINDVFVSWNPPTLKERVNQKRNVSLYSRQSLQVKLKSQEFRIATLSNGEAIVIFERINLASFFNELPNIFNPQKVKVEASKIVPHKQQKGEAQSKLTLLKEKELLLKIKPLLKKNRVLEAVEICSKYYSGKYPDMNFKDWFKLVNEVYQKVAVN